MASFTALSRYPPRPVASGLLRALPSFVPQSANAHDLTCVASFLAAFPHDICQTISWVNEGLLKDQESSGDVAYSSRVQAERTRNCKSAVQEKVGEDSEAVREDEVEGCKLAPAAGERCCPSSGGLPSSAVPSSCFPYSNAARRSSSSFGTAPCESDTSCVSRHAAKPISCVPLLPYPALWNLIVSRLPHTLTSLSSIAVAGILHATVVTRARLLPGHRIPDTRGGALVGDASCFSTSIISEVPHDSCHSSSLTADFKGSPLSKELCCIENNAEIWLAEVLRRAQLQLLRRVPQALGTARPQQISNITHVSLKAGLKVKCHLPCGSPFASKDVDFARKGSKHWPSPCRLSISAHVSCGPAAWVLARLL